MNLTPDVLEAARARGGAPDPERPEQIDDALNRPEVGRGEGEPLVGEGESRRYGHYPSHAEDLSNPKWSEFVTRLFEHPLIGDWDDAVAEVCATNRRPALNRWRNGLEQAAQAYGIFVSEAFAEGEDVREEEREDPLVVALGHDTDLDVDSPLVLAEAYLAGLGTTEIAELSDLAERQVRDKLTHLGLLGGRTHAEQADAFEENKGRLGGATFEVDLDKVEESNNVHVER